MTACVAAALCDTVAAARLRVTVLRTAGRGAVAVAAARGAAAVVFLAAVVFFAAVVFAAVDFAAVTFLFCFSGIRGSLSLLQHGQRTRELTAELAAEKERVAALYRRWEELDSIRSSAASAGT